MFEDAIRILHARIAQITDALASGTHHDRLIDEKISCETAIRTLRFCAENQLGPTLEVLELPPLTGRGMSFYRLMIDNETDDQSLWTRVDSLQGKAAEFMEGSKILCR